MNKLVFLALSSCLALAACKKSGSNTEPAPGSSAAPVADKAPVEGAKPVEGAGEVDLSAGGDAWTGWTIKAPAGTKVVDNGAGGLVVAMKNFQFEMTQGDLNLKDRKDGIKSGLEFSKGTVVYTVDTDEELAYTTETPIPNGTKIKGHGFAIYVTVAGVKVGCSGTLDDEAQVVAAKAACKSLAKK